MNVIKIWTRCLMKNNTMGNLRAFVFLLIILAPHSATSRSLLQECTSSGTIVGTNPPPGQCNKDDDSACCKQGQIYPTYTCSPQTSGSTGAILTLNSFEKGKDGGAASSCDNQYHSDDLLIVALSTGWYSGGSRCQKSIMINGNGNSVIAVVVDECDSTMGCDDEHDYQPPCGNDIVDASRAVWKALGVQGGWGNITITWSDI